MIQRHKHLVGFNFTVFGVVRDTVSCLVASKLDLSSLLVSIVLFRSIFGTFDLERNTAVSLKMSRLPANSHSHTSKRNLPSNSKEQQPRTNMLGDSRVAGNSPQSETQFNLTSTFQDGFSRKRKMDIIEEKPQEALPPRDYDSDEDEKPEELKPKPGKKTRGRVKIHMEYIPNKLRRYTTFSKRKSGMMKKVSSDLLFVTCALRSLLLHVCDRTAKDRKLNAIFHCRLTN